MNKSILVFGGGNPALYDYNYYEIGNHLTADYGAGLNWNELKFWDNLETNMGNKKFRAIIFDSGSESWLPTDETIINKMIDIIPKLINEKGIILYEVDNLTNINIPIIIKIKNKLEESIGLLGTFRYSNKMNMYQVMGVFSKTKDKSKTLLKDTKYINDKTYVYGKKNSGGWFDFIDNNNKVVEKDQVEFLRNRIIVTNEEIDKEIKEISKITNKINTKLDENMELYNSKKEYVINLLE